MVVRMVVNLFRCCRTEFIPFRTEFIPLVERNLFRSLHWSIHLALKDSGIHCVFAQITPLLQDIL